MFSRDFFSSVLQIWLFWTWYYFKKEEMQSRNVFLVTLQKSEALLYLKFNNWNFFLNLYLNTEPGCRQEIHNYPSHQVGYWQHFLNYPFCFVFSSKISVLWKALTPHMYARSGWIDTGYFCYCLINMEFSAALVSLIEYRSKRQSILFLYVAINIALKVTPENPGASLSWPER